MTVQLLGIGKSCVPPFPCAGRTVVFPGRSGDWVLIVSLQSSQRCRVTSFWMHSDSACIARVLHSRPPGRVRGIFPIAHTVGRPIRQDLACRAAITVLHSSVVEIVLLVEIAIAVTSPFVGITPKFARSRMALADLRGEIAGIEPDRTDSQVV